MREGKVYIQNQFAGVIREQDIHHYVFDYDPHYAAEPDAKAVCLAMPLTQLHYESDSLFPYFSNLLSEGENRQLQARYHHLEQEDDFGILLATASYDTIGCVTVKPII